MHESVFDPLWMARTTLRPTVAMTYPLAQGHDIRTPNPRRPPVREQRGVLACRLHLFERERSVAVRMAFVGGGPWTASRRSRRQSSRCCRRLRRRSRVQPTEYGYGVNISMQRGVRMFQHGDRAADTVRASRWCRRNSSASLSSPTGRREPAADGTEGDGASYSALPEPATRTRGRPCRPDDRRRR